MAVVAFVDGEVVVGTKKLNGFPLEPLAFRVEAFRFSFGTSPHALAMTLSFRPALAFPFGLSLAFRFPLTLVATFTLSL